MKKRLMWALLVLVGALTTASAAPTATMHDFELRVLSSPASMVTGGDALVQVTIPRNVPLHKATVSFNGDDVTSTLTLDPEARTLTGMVSGMDLGANRLFADSNGQGKGRPTAELTLVNHPKTGPIFSGPQQQPFVCKTQRTTQAFGNPLGYPQVDNQAGIGMRLHETPGDATTPVIGWSKDCSANTIVDFLYRTKAGEFRPLPAGELPTDVAMTKTLDGNTVPYVVRRERGTINRFIYAISILSPPGDPTAPPDTSLWNRRAIYAFDGGVAIGHNQGTLGGSHLYDPGLSKGYAIIHSSGTRTSTHYNLVLGAETAIMTKERFIEGYGVPLYTVGVGGSGGAIQQYVYAQRHPGVIIDAAIPQYSYPDMVTQTIHIADCELLEHYMDVTDGANPKWSVWPNRTWIEGLNASATWPNPYRGGLPGSSECVNGWRGLTPLALNPHFGSAGDADDVKWYDPAVLAAIKWTHWDDLRNVYGVDADGYAKVPWDNVGVQYGLRALKDGNITPAEFLKLNATVGSWKNTKDMVQEGCPFIPALCSNPAQFDPWSRRNMRLSPDGGVTPAPRREGNMDAANAAYTSGIVFRGDIDIPVIDWRHYLEHRLDMHNSHQSFASRKRMLNFDGDASNQVIWFTDARPGAPQFDQTPMALDVMDEWMLTGKKPTRAVDSCFTTDGSLIYSGGDAWAGILDSRPAGKCTQTFQIFSTSRIVAGGPIEGGVFKCALKPLAAALADGTYGSWQPTPTDVARLQQNFPTGVCDYTKPDVGRPPGL
ncbi:MAG TPA: DUF6351 family protein [Gaiellaceae bacterium]|nr:DUF6351 family protein [Gaiellaceae bacterium]